MLGRCGLGRSDVGDRSWPEGWLAGCFGVFSFFFFFQAEDGIRDLYVTGVQSVLFRSLSAVVFTALVLTVFNFGRDPTAVATIDLAPSILWVTFTFAAMLALNRAFQLELENGARSEERRVGKECRSGWWSAR